MLSGVKHGEATPAGGAPRVVPRNADRFLVRWLTWGSLIPVVGWLYAVTLLWSSQKVTVRSKVIATLAFPGGWFGGIFVMAWAASQTAGGCWTSAYGSDTGVEEVTHGCFQTGLLGTGPAIVLIVVIFSLCMLGPAFVRGDLERASRA